MSRIWFGQCTAAVLLCLGSVVGAVASAQPLSICHIDVENADATLFVALNGQTLPVDSEKNGQSGGRDAATVDDELTGDLDRGDEDGATKTTVGLDADGSIYGSSLNFPIRGHES